MTTRQRLTPTGKLLLRACVKGDMTLANSVLYTDPAALNARNRHGLNALQIAIIHQQLRMAHYLIEKDVNVRSVDKGGWTPLHDAALFGNKELVELIITRGSRITCSNQLGEKPIDVAGNVATEKLLCKCMTNAGFSDLADQYYISLGLRYLKDENNLESDTENQLFPDDAGNSHGGLIGNETIIDTNEYHQTARDFRANRESVLSSKREAILMDINTPCGRLSTFSRDNAKECKRKRTPLSPLREVTEAVVAVPLSETESPTLRRRPSSPVPRQRRSNLAGSKSLVRSHSCEVATADANGEMHLTQEDIAKLNGLFEKNRHPLAAPAERAQEEEEEAFKTPPERESPVELLKMRPRKPSIVSRSGRRESRDSDDGSIASSRRSVTFQPEVLLQEIVTEGDASLVGEVLSSGIVTDVNKMSPVGLTALHQSALDGNLACAKTLVLNGADVNIVDSDGWTPLHAAAASGHGEIVRFFLLAGANSATKTDDGKTAYDLATRKAIKRMLLRVTSGKSVDPKVDEVSDGELSSDEEECNHADYDSDDEDSSLSDSDHRVYSARHSILGCDPGDTSNSPVRESMDSVFSGLHTASVTTVLERDHPSDSTSSYGSLAEQDVELTVGTPSTLCSEDMCIFTDSLVSEDQGFSTMDASSDSSHQKTILSDDEGTSHDVLDCELEPGTLDYKFQEAVLNGDDKSLSKLIKQRSEINVNRVNTTSGVSALHHSVLEDNFTLVQHLVKDFECNVNLKDVEGWTPLHAASAVGSIRIAQFLLDNGAKPSILNNNGGFPVDVAEDAAMEALLKKAMLGPLHAAGKLIVKGIYI